MFLGVRGDQGLWSGFPFGEGDYFRTSAVAGRRRRVQSWATGHAIFRAPHTASSSGKRQVRAPDPPSWRAPIRFLSLRFWTGCFERYIARREWPRAGVCAVYPCNDGRCQSLLRVQSVPGNSFPRVVSGDRVHARLRTAPSCVYNGPAKLRIHNITCSPTVAARMGTPCHPSCPYSRTDCPVDTESYVLPSEPKTTEPGSAI
ncbi:hypothetical protein F5141DRAFT_44652 [Pisolithus sp. B1]|nr:hypothetical protein F5141DRAFT_44652 [Pisolithus sp. B1]